LLAAPGLSRLTVAAPRVAGAVLTGVKFSADEVGCEPIPLPLSPLFFFCEPATLR